MVCGEALFTPHTVPGHLLKTFCCNDQKRCCLQTIAVGGLRVLKMSLRQSVERHKCSGTTNGGPIGK